MMGTASFCRIRGLGKRSAEGQNSLQLSGRFLRTVALSFLISCLGVDLFSLGALWNRIPSSLSCTRLGSFCPISTFPWLLLLHLLPLPYTHSTDLSRDVYQYQQKKIVASEWPPTCLGPSLGMSPALFCPCPITLFTGAAPAGDPAIHARLKDD